MSKFLCYQRRLLILQIGVLFAFLCVCARLCYLHVFNSEKLQAIVERNRYKFETLYARRGDIKDTKGNLLATTTAMMTLGVDPQMMRLEDSHKWPFLSNLGGVPLIKIQEAFNQKIDKDSNGSGMRLVRWKKLVDIMDDTTYEKIMQLKIKGVYGNRQFQRIYPSGKQGAHVLGFINKESQAIGGVEQFMDFYLRGQDGFIETQCDGKRREMAQYRMRQVPPKNGHSVELSIDLNIQYILEKIIEEIIQQYHPDAVTIIVGDPDTGYILGLANAPTYDPNTFWDYELSHHRNRAITDVYEPGSTFKIVAGCGALNEKLVKPEDKFDCRLTTMIYQGRVVKLPKDHRPMGVLTMREVVSHSSNRGLAQLGMKLGDKAMYTYAKNFGFGEMTGYDGLGEVSGVLHPVNRWDGLTISRLPIGHAVSVTPLQTHMAMSVVANGGLLFKPLILKKVLDQQGDTLLNFEPRIKRRVIPKEVADTMRSFLYEVAKNQTIRGVPVGYKTGTTQKIINGKYSHSDHISSTSGFLYGKNQKLVITLVIDAPAYKGTAYGSLVAAPYFKKIAEELAHYLSIQPD